MQQVYNVWSESLQNLLFQIKKILSRRQHLGIEIIKHTDT